MLAALISLITLLGAANAFWYDELVSRLRVPAGFEVAVFAEVEAARSMTISSTGTVFVGAYDFTGIQGASGQQLAVHALRDLDGNHDALGPHETTPVTERMPCPNGVAVVGSDLFVAQMHRIFKIPNVETDIETIKTPVQVVGMEEPEGAGNGLPDTSWHGWRYIVAKQGASDKLYVAIGSPCNVPGNGEILDCNDTTKHPLLGSISELSVATGALRPVAHGIRNTLGMDFHPKTGDLWFTDNGRDQWGGVWSSYGDPPRWNLVGGAGTEDMPPGELNRIPGGAGGLELNLDFGFPRCYGRDHPDPSPDSSGVAFNPTMDCPPYGGGGGSGGDRGYANRSRSGNSSGAITTSAQDAHLAVGSVVDLPPHSATLGLRFYEPPPTSRAPPAGSQFPARYHGRALFAEHGSWDRTMPTGYAVGSTAIVSEDGADESAVACSTTGPYRVDEFLTGFRLEPPVRCAHSTDCPGNSSCQSRAPSHGQQQLYCGGMGRPSDLVVLPDGSLLVSDEMNSLVYRVSYKGDKSGCTNALTTLCGGARRSSRGDCLVCAGTKTAVRAAGCAETDIDKFCDRKGGEAALMGGKPPDHLLTSATLAVVVIACAMVVLVHCVRGMVAMRARAISQVPLVQGHLVLDDADSVSQEHRKVEEAPLLAQAQAD